MQYDTLNKVKILITDDKTNIEKYVCLKDVILFIESNVEITLGEYIERQQHKISDLEIDLRITNNKIDNLESALSDLTGIISQLNLK